MDRNEAPQVAAIFRVIFDQKVGYTIAWQRSLPEINLDGVEFKSLPSGLHGVRSDLIYFTHGEDYAGISAFAQEVADARQRNANFVAVGVLVPVASGRLGRGWAHAAELKTLAGELVKNASDARPLELFWKKHRLETTGSGPAPSGPHQKSLPSGAKRRRGLSDASTGLRVDSEGATDHPALHMPELLDSFGPLLFPLYRAALLRKRILFLGSPPVQRNCNAVYILSVLSSLPHSLTEVLRPDAEPLFRSNPLFSVGIPDIPTLSARDGRSGWLATTTDDILGEKHQLWDVVVELPPAEPGSRKRWLKVRTSEGKVVKATQRDLRRYRSLRAELKRMRLERSRGQGSTAEEDDHDDDEERPLVHPNAAGSAEHTTPADAADDETEVVEPVSWSAMAYDSFMWWASTGEELGWKEEERAADLELLADFADIHDAMPHSLGDGEDRDEQLHEAEETATVLTAYFHRLSGLIIQTLASIVEEADDQTEEGVEEDAIEVRAEDIKRMGLDVGSEWDRIFVGEMMKLYFGREAAVQSRGVRLCGVKVC